MRLHRSLALLSLAPLLAACSSSSDEKSGEPRTEPELMTDDTSDEPDPIEEDDWTVLVDGEWSLEAGGEIDELCIKQEVTEDLYVRAIRPIHPPGTHHTLLSQSDGSTGCNSSLRANSLIYAAGVGSEGLVMPDGVAMKLDKGIVLGLGLHLYNTSTEDITGRSGMEVVLAEPDEVEHLAEAVLAGPFNISIPPGEHSQSGECTLQQEQTVVAIFPHMHQLGTHFRASFIVDGQEQVVHDAPYDFEEQYQLVLDEPIRMSPGDSMVTECTWQNPTAETVGFGESSDTEMCFNVVFQYPARGTAFCGASSSSGDRPELEGPACAAEGDEGNELGVGKYCTREGGQCESGICLNDYVDGEAGNFCSTTCSTDEDCGTGAVCVGDGARAVCFPETCAASTSTGADAGADAG